MHWDRIFPTISEADNNQLSIFTFIMNFAHIIAPNDYAKRARKIETTAIMIINLISNLWHDFAMDNAIIVESDS